MVNLMPPFLLHVTLAKHNKLLGDTLKLFFTTNAHTFKFFMEETMDIPPVEDWYNSSPVFSYGLECRLRHVKVRSGWITPTTIITWECIVGRAEVGGSDGNVFILEAPLRHLSCITGYLIEIGRAHV